MYVLLALALAVMIVVGWQVARTPPFEESCLLINDFGPSPGEQVIPGPCP